MGKLGIMGIGNKKLMQSSEILQSDINGLIINIITITIFQTPISIIPDTPHF